MQSGSHTVSAGSNVSAGPQPMLAPAPTPHEGAAIAYPLPAVPAHAAPAARRRRRTRLLLAADAALLAVALLVAIVSEPARTGAGSIAWALIFALSTLTLIVATRGYRRKLEVSPFEYLGNVVKATATAGAFVITARVLLDPEPGAAGEVARLWVFATAYLVCGRFAAAIASRRSNRKGIPTLVVGAGSVGRLVTRRLLERPEIGLQPVGFLDKDPRDRDDESMPPVLGASWDLERLAREHRVEHVVVTFSTAPHDVLLNLVKRCRALGIEVSLVPRLFEMISNRVALEHLGGVPLLRVDQADPRGWQFDVKYAVDRVVASIIILLMSPLLLALAALVKLSSPGPILYRQSRVGLDGREFDILKFRTMRVADESQQLNAGWAARQAGGEVDAEMPLDDRRTPIGRFMRRWSVDELPQLLNLARGDMSFIGPRPEQARFVATFEGHVYRYGDRHRVRSGLTGWAQVHGLRGDTSLADRVEWDNWYVENWSPLLDLKILALTLPAVISGRSAE